MKIPAPTSPAEAWMDTWFNAVLAGASTMSQRKLTSIESKGGGIGAVRQRAKEKGIHLLLLEDDKGDQLVAASLKPFKIVC